jgi:Tfp pilus assembly protein FimT
MAILAAVALPRVIAASPFQERGYADVVTASLRQARAVALASSCAVQFTIDGNGYRALQRDRDAATGHCVAAGDFVTPVLDGTRPRDAVLAANRVLVFSSSGALAGGAVNINIGPQAIVVHASGVVQGP